MCSEYITLVTNSDKLLSLHINSMKTFETSLLVCAVYNMVNKMVFDGELYASACQHFCDL